MIAVGELTNPLDTFVLDLMGDDSEQMVKKKNALMWDRKKKKYIQAGSGEIWFVWIWVFDSSLDVKSKKKNEAGVAIGKNYKSKNLYKDWQQKTKVSMVFF